MKRQISQRLFRAPLIFLALCFLFASSATAAEKDRQKRESPVLGDGRGLDHIVIFVRDLEAAKDTYRDTLGFAVPPRGDVYTLPSGFKFSETAFRETFQYLEWREIDDRKKAEQYRSRFVNFVEKHEGALILVLDVSSAKSTTNFLRRRGFNVSDPFRAPPYTEPLPSSGGTVTFEKTFEPADPELGITDASPTKAIAFTEYSAVVKETRATEKPEDWPTHPNTARRIASVWIAVKNLRTATRAYASIGLHPSKKRRLPVLGGVGREIEAGQGVILLLQPQGGSGKVAAFLADRGEGIMGVSIEVRDLKAAREYIEKTTKRTFTPYPGSYGQSILIPGDLAHGVWLELFQQ